MHLVGILFILVVCFVISQGITVGDVMTAVPEVAKFNTQVPVLRLPKSNYFFVNGTKYELRFFSFYMGTDACSVFDMYARGTNITDQPLLPYPTDSLINPLSFVVSDNTTYLVLSVLPACKNCSCGKK
jgi:hypothetical protein